MNLTIRNDGFEMSEAIDMHVRDRLAAALDQHQSHVRSVAVTVRDENGPRGGIDKSCLLQVFLDTRREPVIIRKLHENMYLAVTDAADAVKRTVGRLVGKTKKHR